MKPRCKPSFAQQAQTLVQLKVQETRIHNELYQLLTPDQQSKLKEFEANREARMQQAHAAPPPHPPLLNSSKTEPREALYSKRGIGNSHRSRAVSSGKAQGMMPWKCL